MSAPIPNKCPPIDRACWPDVNPPAATGFQLWFASPTGLRHFDPAILTASDRRRFDAMRNRQRREEFAVSRALLAQVAVAAPSSLSHSGGHAALVRGPCGYAVGVDLEQHRCRDVASIAQFAFNRVESDALLAMTGPERERTFYSLWVMKEALAKALQLPLLEALRSCVFRRQDHGWSGAAPTRRPWSVTVFEPRPRMTLAVASVGNGVEAMELEIREWPSGNAMQWSHPGARVTNFSSLTPTLKDPLAFAAMRQNPGESSTCRTVLPTP